MADAEPPPLHTDHEPPQAWLRVLVTEILEHKVSVEVLTAGDDCSLPFLSMTGELRERLKEYPDRFQRTMDKLGQRVAAALGSLELDGEELGQKLCERAKVALLARASLPEPEAEVAAEADVKMETPRAKPDEAPDAVFERAREAQRVSLSACGQKDLLTVAQKGELGFDGKVRIADGWKVELTPVPPNYKKDAKPRGKN
eukprot:97222-Prymnesium_polylepis.1